ncbi:MAG: hypothetical protein RMI91_01360 [Gemmatales bacterium]|nr:hypothetical protein [Gemmatales bacterium]MDW7993280.1 hypothetical protein [Gemmatales bacterium]
MFTTVASVLLTASTAVVCAVAVAARPCSGLVILTWLAVGALGGFCAGLGFAWLVRQIRAATRPGLSLDNQAFLPTDTEWDFIYAGADFGWTVGLATTIVLDVNRWLTTDDHYLLGAGIPIIGAALGGFWASRRRAQFWRLNAVAVALALLTGLLSGVILVQSWAGLQDIFAWLVAGVVGIHLAVSLALLSNLVTLMVGHTRAERSAS